jgi:hypothetical protein
MYLDIYVWMNQKLYNEIMKTALIKVPTCPFHLKDITYDSFDTFQCFQKIYH